MSTRAGMLDRIAVGPAMESPPTEEAVRRMTTFLESGIRWRRGQTVQA